MHGIIKSFDYYCLTITSLRSASTRCSIFLMPLKPEECETYYQFIDFSVFTCSMICFFLGAFKILFYLFYWFIIDFLFYFKANLLSSFTYFLLRLVCLCDNDFLCVDTDIKQVFINIICPVSIPANTEEYCRYVDDPNLSLPI